MELRKFLRARRPDDQAVPVRYHAAPKPLVLIDNGLVEPERFKIFLDRKIDLPAKRTQELRTTAEFAREQQALFEALKGEEP